MSAEHKFLSRCFSGSKVIYQTKEITTPLAKNVEDELNLSYYFDVNYLTRLIVFLPVDNTIYN